MMMKNNMYDIYPIYSPALEAVKDKNYEDLEEVQKSNVKPYRYYSNADKCKWCGSLDIGRELTKDKLIYRCKKCGKITSEVDRKKLKNDAVTLFGALHKSFAK